MDNDYISAVCPKCGGKLQVETNAYSMTCQFCGSEHIIRHSSTGSVSLEAYASCPLCQRNDRSEKVTAIINSQTNNSNSFVNQQQVFQDKRGQSYTRTIKVPVQTTNSSNLAQRLAPPIRPTPPINSGSKILILKVSAIILMIISICSCLNAILTFNLKKPNFIIFGLMPFFLAVSLFVIWYFFQTKAKEKSSKQDTNFNNYIKRWELAMSRWKKLYYCGRDDIVFIPGEKGSSNISDLLAFLYSDPIKTQPRR